MTKNTAGSLPVFDYETCTACTSCVEVCPVSCLSLEIENGPSDRRAYPGLGKTGAATCIGCAFCAEDCPVEAIEMIAEAQDVAI